MEPIDYRLKKTSLYEQIAAALEQAIVVPGEEGREREKLPSEQALAAKFGVSRTVVREALKLLKERGLVELRTGDGSYITRPRSDTISSVVNRIILMENIGDEEIYAMRVILESAACRLAALQATGEGLASLEGLLAQMRERKDDLPARIRLDTNFHVAIARLSGNQLLGIFVEAMTSLLTEFISKGIRAPGGNEDGLARHAAILAAIEARDPGAAEAAMRNHLEVSRQNVREVTGKGA